MLSDIIAGYRLLSRVIWLGIGAPLGVMELPPSVRLSSAALPTPLGITSPEKAVRASFSSNIVKEKLHNRSSFLYLGLDKD